MFAKLMCKNRKILSIFAIAALILSVFFIGLPSKVYAAAVWYVDGLNGDDGHGGHSFGDAKKTIQATITAATAGDTIFVAATADYPEDLTIDKSLTFLGLKANGTTDSWTTYTPGSEDGPAITYDGAHTNMINFAADDITMKGFEIDTTGAGNWGIYFAPAGTVADNAGISYCDFTLDTADRAIVVETSNTLTNSEVKYCAFDGPADGNSFWFQVGPGTGASGDGGNVSDVQLENNDIREAVSYLSLDGDITNVAYNYNDFYQIRGGVRLEEPVEQGPCDFTNISVNGNTFSDGSFVDEYVVLVADNVEDADIASGDWSTDLQITGNTISMWGANTYPAVSFEGGVHGSNINAQNNYWGSSTGPYNAIGNPTGDGVEVGNTVDFAYYKISAYWTGSGTATTNIALASSNGNLYEARVSTNGNLYTRVSPNGSSWSNWVNGGCAQSNITMVDFNSKLYQAKRGHNNYLYTRSTSDGVAWSSWVNGGTCKATIAMAVFSNKLFQTKRGSSGCFYGRYSSNGTTWSKWVRRGLTIGGLTMASFGSKIYQTKRTSNGHVYISSSSNGTSWSSWTHCGPALSSLTLTEFSSRLYQAKRSEDGNLYTRSSANGTDWNPWIEGGACVGNVTMVSFNGKLYQLKNYTGTMTTFRSSDDGTLWDPWQYELPGNSDINAVQFGNELYQALRSASNVAYITVFY